MQRKASQSNSEAASPAILSVRTRRQHPAPYQRVKDERKRPIRGLWVRNGRFPYFRIGESGHGSTSGRVVIPDYGFDSGR
jgi:hypothetical protein